MTAGRGFIALVAIMLARSHPIGVGLARARCSGSPTRSRCGCRASGIPPQFVAMLPYVLTLAALVLLRAGVRRCAPHEARRARHGRGDRRRDRDRAARRARGRRGRRARQRPRQLLGRDSTRNALVVLEACGLGDVPVARGAAGAARGRRSTSPASSTAPTGSATSASPLPRARRRGEHAADQIVRLGARGTRASSTCSPSARSPTSGSRCSATRTRSRATARW